MNEGGFAEDVTVTAYVNSTVIGTQTVNGLAPGAQITITIVWNASDFAKGAH